MTPQASRFIAALAACAALASACASISPRAEEGEGAYVVVQTDAGIFPAGNVNGFEVVDRDTLLLRAGANRLYLADIGESCGRDLRFSQSIGLDHRGSSSVDDFSQVLIDDRRCPLENLRRVERKPAEQGGAASAPADGG